MSAVHASTLLTVWDEAVSEPPVQRALSLLSAAWPQTSRSEWACMPIGARDAALLDLQDGLFGSDIEATADCPKCGERAEISFTTSQIRTPLPSREALTLARDEYEIEFRVPTTEDLLVLPDDSPEAEWGLTSSRTCAVAAVPDAPSLARLLYSGGVWRCTM